MGANSKIAWTDHTFNPWIGCTKVSPGCAHCYAETLMATRYGRVEWGAGKPRVRTSAANWKQPLRWNREESSKMVTHEEFIANRRPRVFCASLADWLDDEVPIEWLADLLDLIRSTPDLDWLLLTKRPQNWSERLSNAYVSDNKVMEDFVNDWLLGHPPKNVWVGTTVEDQPRADERIPALLDIPARVRFLSCEPLLGPVDISQNYWLTGQARRKDKTLNPPGSSSRIHWVIIGGESGSDAREFPMEHAWDLFRQCSDAGVPVFVKQLGDRPVTTNANLYDWPDETTLEQHGTEAAGARPILRSRSGRDLTEWPEQFQQQDFPSVS